MGRDGLRALGKQCFADVGEGDMDGGQIEVKCMRWTFAWTVAVVAWTACVRSVFQAPAARDEE